MADSITAVRRARSHAWDAPAWQPASPQYLPRPPVTPAPPHVLVIVTSYAYGAFVTRALASVAAQTYRDFTCVIVDDNSPDGSADIIAQWIARRGDPRFRLVRRETNAGQLAAIATGLAAADGQFVALLDADDIWFPDHLATHINTHLQRIGYAAFTCSDMVQIDAEDRLLAGTVRGESFFATPRRPRAVSFANDTTQSAAVTNAVPTDASPAIFIKPDIHRWHWTATSAMVFRRAMLDLVMPDPLPPIPLCADHYLAHACHFFTGSILVQSSLGGYRRHGGNGYSRLAVYGTCAAHAPFHDDRHNRANMKVLLSHVLDRRLAFESIFGTAAVRALVSTLAGHQLRTERRLTDQRIHKFLGAAGVARAFWREHLRRLRQN